MKKLMMAMSLAALACGCVSVNKNDGGNSNLKLHTVRDAMHLKYEVGKDRVAGCDQLNCLFGFIYWGSTAHTPDQSEFGFGVRARVKDGAYANACDGAKCDQIVAARYKITVDDYFVFQKAKAEVNGFPARVTSVEVMDGVKCPPPPPPKKSAAPCGLLPF